MGNNTSRNYTYQQYYDVIKKKKGFDFNSINYDELNPYETLNVSKNYTWDELKTNYKKIAFETHPDKEGGNEIVFNYVTECFKKLAYDYKKRKDNKLPHELKNSSKEYYETSLNKQNNDFINDNESTMGFNEKFNRTFEKCRLEDEETEFGYGDMMEKSSKNREDISVDKVYQEKKFNTKSFNDIFNKHIPITKQLTKYQEPIPTQLTKSINYTELGSKKPDDYSSPENKTNLIYTDYLKAYSNNRIDTESVIKTKKDFNNVTEYEKYRDKLINKKISDKEKKIMELKKEKEEKDEYERLERLKMLDQKIEKNYNKANKLFLK